MNKDLGIKRGFPKDFLSARRVWFIWIILVHYMMLLKKYIIL